MALVVGGSRNIGLAIAEGLAGCGAAVVLASRAKPDVEAAAAAPARPGGASGKAANVLGDGQRGTRLWAPSPV